MDWRFLILVVEGDFVLGQPLDHAYRQHLLQLKHVLNLKMTIIICLRVMINHNHALNNGFIDLNNDTDSLKETNGKRVSDLPRDTYANYYS